MNIENLGGGDDSDVPETPSAPRQIPSVPPMDRINLNDTLFRRMLSN